MSFERAPGGPPPPAEALVVPGAPGWAPPTPEALPGPQPPEAPLGIAEALKQAVLEGTISGAIGAAQVLAGETQRQQEIDQARAQAEAARRQAAARNVPYEILLEQAKANWAPQPGDTVTLADAPSWPKGLRPKFHDTDDPGVGDRQGDIRGTSATVVGGFTRTGPIGSTERPISGIVVSGTGVIGTAEDAKRLREPHAREGVTPVNEALDIVGDSREVAFRGLMGRMRRKRSGDYLGKVLEHSREADVEAEAAASVVHARKPVAGLEPETRGQERTVRKAVDMLEKQQASNVMVARNLYAIRADARQNGIKDAGNMSADQITAALAASGRRLSASQRKTLKEAGRRMGKAAEHAEHAAHQLHDMAAGESPTARVQTGLRDQALRVAGKAVDKQGRKETEKAAERQSLGGSEGRRMR